MHVSIILMTIIIIISLELFLIMEPPYSIVLKSETAPIALFNMDPPSTILI